MIRFAAVVATFGDVQDVELYDWIARGWVRPEPADGDDWLFAEIDLARLRLIRDLRHGMAVEEETMPVVLGLLDQVYDLRRALRSVTRVLEDQPPTVRDALRRALEGRI